MNIKHRSKTSKRFLELFEIRTFYVSYRNGTVGLAKTADELPVVIEWSLAQDVLERISRIEADSRESRLPYGLWAPQPVIDWITKNVLPDEKSWDNRGIKPLLWGAIRAIQSPGAVVPVRIKVFYTNPFKYSVRMSVSMDDPVISWRIDLWKMIPVAHNTHGKRTKPNFREARFDRIIRIHDAEFDAAVARADDDEEVPFPPKMRNGVVEWLRAIGVYNNHTFGITLSTLDSQFKEAYEKYHTLSRKAETKWSKTRNPSAVVHLTGEKYLRIIKSSPRPGKERKWVLQFLYGDECECATVEYGSFLKFTEKYLLKFLQKKVNSGAKYIPTLLKVVEDLQVAEEVPVN